MNSVLFCYFHLCIYLCVCLKIELVVFALLGVIPEAGRTCHLVKMKEHANLNVFSRIIATISDLRVSLFASK